MLSSAQATPLHSPTASGAVSGRIALVCCAAVTGTCCPLFTLFPLPLVILFFSSAQKKKYSCDRAHRMSYVRTGARAPLIGGRWEGGTVSGFRVRTLQVSPSRGIGIRALGGNQMP